jgi:hypothetical protein
VIPFVPSANIYLAISAWEENEELFLSVHGKQLVMEHLGAYCIIVYSTFNI